MKNPLSILSPLARAVTILLALHALFAAAPTIADSVSTNVAVNSEQSCSVSGAFSGNSSAACLASFLGESGTASAVASQASGTIGALAGFSTTNGHITSTGDTSSEAGMTYDFSVANGPPSGTITLSVTTSGTSQVAYNGCGPSGPQFCSGFAGSVLTSEELLNGSVVSLSNTPLSSGMTTMQVQIPYSQAMVPSESLFLFLDAGCNEAAQGPGTCNATANFFDTVQITGAQVFDSSGVLVPGAIVISESGFNPNGGAVSVAEPGALALLVPGMYALGALRRKASAAQIRVVGETGCSG